MIQSKMKQIEWFKDVQGQLTPQSSVRSGQISNSFETLWLSLLPEKLKNIRSKIKALVFTTLYIKFSDAQGQITPKLVMVSVRNVNSSKLSCMSSLPVGMKMIQS